MIKTFGMILLLCVPVAVTAQTRVLDLTNLNQAKRMGANVEQTLKVKERKWKLKVILESEFGSQHYFKSGKNEMIFTFFVYNSPEEASKQLQFDANGSSITAPSELKDIGGDEAFYMSHRYFTWIGVRKGRMLVEVYRTDPNLTVTRRFVAYDLEELEKALGHARD